MLFDKSLILNESFFAFCIDNKSIFCHNIHILIRKREYYEKNNKKNE
jgi:hypothetical protein